MQFFKHMKHFKHLLKFLILKGLLKAPSLCAHDEANGLVDPAREPWQCVSVQRIKQNI